MTDPQSCPHRDLTLLPEDSTTQTNVYQCVCGVVGFRLWTRGGLQPFKPHLPETIAQRRGSAKTVAWNDARAQRIRDRAAARRQQFSTWAEHVTDLTQRGDP